MAKKSKVIDSRQLDWVNLDKHISYVNTEDLEDWQIEWLNVNGYSIRAISDEIAYQACSSNYSSEHNGKWIDLLMERELFLRTRMK